MNIKATTLFILALSLSMASPVLAQQSGAGDATNSQQNGDNHQTATGGQPGGASDRQ